MWDPYKKLEEFENKHGEYGDLLDNYVKLLGSGPALDEARATEISKAANVLKNHEKLVWACVSYSRTKEKIINKIKSFQKKYKGGSFDSCCAALLEEIEEEL